MNIEMLRIEEIKPYEKNPRKNDNAVDKVAESIRNFGFKVPLVVDKDMVVVAGHTRLKAAVKLGIKEVPCIIADDLNDNQINAFRLADNKVAEFSVWDDELIFSELNNITDIDMESMGFLKISADDFGTDFELPSGEKDPFQQMTFMLANAQAELIKEALKDAKGDKYDNYGNENTNGNALYRIVREWVEQKI